jgi:hypothetical protein
MSKLNKLTLIAIVCANTGPDGKDGLVDQMLHKDDAGHFHVLDMPDGTHSTIKLVFAATDKANRKGRLLVMCLQAIRTTMRFDILDARTLNELCYNVKTKFGSGVINNDIKEAWNAARLILKLPPIVFDCTITSKHIVSWEVKSNMKEA